MYHFMKILWHLVRFHSIARSIGDTGDEILIRVIIGEIDENYLLEALQQRNT